MKNHILCVLIVLLSLSGCDVQSEITKKSVEKYSTTPTPQVAAEPAEPIDAADIVNVDVNQEGPKLLVNTLFKKTALDCNKYNRVSVNGDGWEVNIKGACKQLVVNGDRNKINVNAVTEVMLNGPGNTVRYTKYVNGKRPVVGDNGAGNLVEKVAGIVSVK